MSIDENKAIARRWGDDIWGKGDLAAADDLLAPDLTFTYPPPGAAPDREAYKQMVTMFHVGFPNVQFTAEDMVAEGDKVVVRWTSRGSHTGEFAGVAPTGRQVTITGISILRIAGEKIVEDWTEENALGMMQQLGVIPAPD